MLMQTTEADWVIGGAVGRRCRCWLGDDRSKRPAAAAGAELDKTERQLRARRPWIGKKTGFFPTLSNSEVVCSKMALLRIND